MNNLSKRERLLEKESYLL